MYRNDMYSNTSESGRSRGGSWVYINGELYHAGVKGMKWGKHLPGTDWWKETTNKYYSQHPNIQTVAGGRQYAAQPTKLTKAKANLYTAGQAAKAYGRIIGSTARTYRDKAIMKGYQAKRAITGKINNTAYKVKKGARNLYNNIKVSGSTLVKDLSSKVSSGIKKGKNFISNYANKAYSSITSSANKYKDKVNDFISKVTGKKSTGTSKSLSGKQVNKPKVTSVTLTGNPISKPGISSVSLNSKKPTYSTGKISLSSQRSQYYKE